MQELPQEGKEDEEGQEVSYDEHMAWCKERAFSYCEQGKAQEAWSSFISDLNKHDETRGHSAIELGMTLYMAGHLSRVGEMRRFIEGFR